jgi:hypothetical protein
MSYASSDLDRTAEGYQHMVDDIYPRLAQLVTQRYQTYTQKTLQDVYNLDQDFIQVESEAVEFTAAHRKEIIAILKDPQLLSSLVRLFVISTLEFTYANNQFVHVDGQKELQLENLYRSYLLDMKAILIAEKTPLAIRGGLKKLIAKHFEDLRSNLENYFDPDIELDIEGNMIFNRVICRQYSPEFQLDILGISLEDLREPILDFGCGKSGRLVSYLTERGFQAFGVDRIVEPAEHIIAADWLNFKLEPGTWGTIISHMAFSNHFSFHHLYKNGNPEPYARQYIAILSALFPGGAFYYSPGLPFIEELLPASSYTVTRRKVSASRNIRSSFSEFGGEDLYTTQIKRR